MITDEELDSLLSSADQADKVRAESDGFQYETWGTAEEIDPEWRARLEPEVARRLVAEVWRLRTLAECEACVRELRRADDGLHYDDANGGGTWGVCRSVANSDRLTELNRLRESRKK